MECYNCNFLICDNHSPCKVTNYQELFNHLVDFQTASDSLIFGVFDEEENYLYGYILFDNIRITKERSCAQVHILNHKAIWGRALRDLYIQFLHSTIFDTVYCEIPAIAAGAIGVCKKMGFKKTGYVPHCLPYTDIRGNERMYDKFIYVWEREENE